jgi:polygalacturonase
VPAGTEFTLVGGIEAENLMNNTIIFDGSLSFEFDEDVWPTNSDSDDKFKHCINIWNAQDLVISGSGSGIINGNGRPWWDKMIAGTLPGSGDTRPKLFNVANSVDVLIENIHLVNSPSWNLIVS